MTRKEITADEIRDTRKIEIVTSTPFDDVYRTLTSKITKLVIPLINEMFSTAYRQDEPIRQIRNEYFTRSGKIITDSIYEIGEMFYHVECQSGNDAAMSIRMFEYDVSIAIEHADKSEGETTIRFPRSGVIYVRDNMSTPDEHFLKIIMPNGKEMVYSCEVTKVSNYSLQKIFDRNLLLMLPYYILRYEKRLDMIEEDQSMHDRFLDDLQMLMQKLDEATNKQNNTVLFEDLHDAIRKISDHVLRKNKQLHKEVKTVMGGNIYKLPSEYIEEGRAEGHEKGLAEGRADMIYCLVEDGDLPPEKGAKKLGVTTEQLMKDMLAAGRRFPADVDGLE